MLFIALISVFALFFNVERLDIGNVTIVNIETYVYALGIIICIAVVGLPKLWLRSVYLPIGVNLVAYLALKLVMIHERPLFGGIYTYLTITESSSLVLIAWLSYQLISPLLQFEETVKTYTYDIVATKIPDPQKSKKIIRTEITRSRRY